MMNIDDKLIEKGFVGMVPLIKELIKEKGYKHKFVAEKIGITEQQLSNWVNGTSYPRLDKAYKLAEILECTVEDLYKKDE